MKRISVMVITILLFGLPLILTNETEVVNADNGSIRGVFDWTMDMNISDVSTGIFLGEFGNDRSGVSVSIVGDVNGDGFDDIVIGAMYNDEGSYLAGQTYLILGKDSGWDLNISLSFSDASFIGERLGDYSGISVSGAGDVNGDGYDDFLIGADQYGASTQGETYLIFGKASGWSMDTNLSQADASFIGENRGDRSGCSVSGAGDVNGDGYDDFLIGAEYNSEGGTSSGQTYLILGKPSGWSMDTSLSKSDASFIGEGRNDNSGCSVSSAGDVNGDGYDDIIIGAWRNRLVDIDSGQTYLILGKSTGWSMDNSLSNSDASFTGESTGGSGFSISDAGDVNGDGYDDIIIGACYDSEQDFEAGQTYLIFGKKSGWGLRMNLSKSDASFLGEKYKDRAGFSVSGAGDINADGYDDFLIGSYLNDEGGSGKGQTYLIYGKSTGWAMDINLSKVDVSFLGDFSSQVGYSVSGIGDVNGDGFSDILIGTPEGSCSSSRQGITYLITGLQFTEPLEVYSLKAFSDELFTNEIDSAEINDEIFIELQGLDGNSSIKDRARLMISICNEETFNFSISLFETGFNTGIYRNSIKLSTKFDLKNRLINASIGDIINISSITDPSKNVLIEVVTPLALKPLTDEVTALEDEEYRVHYWNFGYNEVSEWSFDTNSDWLTFDKENQDIYGTPDNGDVGNNWVRINISDGLGHYDEHSFEINIINTPPCISPIENIDIIEDDPFQYDCECDDERVGDTEYDIFPASIKWLDFDRKSGILSGTPLGEDSGSYDINISVDDGNGGLNWTEFNLTVIDRNDPPIIQTEPIIEIEQGDLYYVQFNAIDEDDIHTFVWTMETDAKFLEINNKSGVLSGTPDNDDVGFFFINITATDLRGLSDWTNYTLEVIDANDPPTWSITPSDTQIDQGKEYTFTALAIDVDIGDTVSYSISSNPDSEICIDQDTGIIIWTSTLENLYPNPNYVLNVEIIATDGIVTISHGFTLTVIPNPSPISTLSEPENGKRITSYGIMLKWEGEDDGKEPLKYDIYLGLSETEVSLQRESTLWMVDFEEKKIHTGELETGKTYYWTVIPKDIYSSGACGNGVFFFYVNVPPSIQEISIPEATIGVEFRLSFAGSDLNNDDLEFHLQEGPSGMELLNGMITWTPLKSQIGTHIVNISLSDGYETIFKEFEVTVTEKEEVSEPDERGSPVVLIIVAIIVILVVLGGAGVGLFLFMKNKGEEELSKESSDENFLEDSVHKEEEKQADSQLNSIEN
jgi:hypothetical protein